MPSATAIITIQVNGRDKLAQLAKRLEKEGGGGLRKRLDSGLEKSGNKALQMVRAAWMGVDVQSSGAGGYDGPSGGSTGLRGRIAAATLLHKISGGLRYQTHSRMVDGRYGDTLTHGVNGTPWAHPVFGNRSAWPKEVGEEVFYSTLNRCAPVWEQGLANAVENSARYIAGG